MCGEVEEGERYVNAFVGETGWHGGAFFFGFGEEDGEFLDGGHGDVAAVVAGEEGLDEVVSGFACARVEGDGVACFALEVEEEYGGGHGQGLCRRCGEMGIGVVQVMSNGVALSDIVSNEEI